MNPCLQRAYDACGDLTAPAGGGKFSQGWIVARKMCRAEILRIMMEPQVAQSAKPEKSS